MAGIRVLKQRRGDNINWRNWNATGVSDGANAVFSRQGERRGGDEAMGIDWFVWLDSEGFESECVS